MLANIFHRLPSDILVLPICPRWLTFVCSSPRHFRFGRAETSV